MRLIKGFFEMMMDLWSGDWMDKGMFFIMLITVALLLGLCALPFFMYYDHLEMKAMHCRPTDQTKTYTTTGTMLVGKVIIPTTREQTDRLYICDDVNRWR